MTEAEMRWVRPRGHNDEKWSRHREGDQLRSPHIQTHMQPRTEPRVAAAAAAAIVLTRSGARVVMRMLRLSYCEDCQRRTTRWCGSLNRGHPTWTTVAVEVVEVGEEVGASGREARVAKMNVRGGA